jgi:Zn-dependent alcohol dehydrogenase
MATIAQVAVLPKDSQTLEIIETELPPPDPDQVEIRQFASGICHSQLHQIHRQRQRHLLLGHESTGVVNRTGENVTHVEAGDMVLVTWVPRNASAETVPPGNISLEIGNYSAWSRDVFTWADHTIADQQYVVKVDPDIAKDVTAIIGCAVMTGAGAVINTAGVQAGQSVAVFGAGGVGLTAIVAARLVGANPIIAVDLEDEKLEFARQFGATHTVNASNVDPVDAIHNLTCIEGQFAFQQVPLSGADHAFDCIGVPRTMEQIVAACRKGQFGVRAGGKAVLVGIPGTTLELNTIDIVLAEKSFCGSIGGSCVPDRDLPKFVEWHRRGDLDLNALVTRRYCLDQINEAVNALASGEILGRAILEF